LIVFLAGIKNSLNNLIYSADKADYYPLKEKGVAGREIGEDAGFQMRRIRFATAHNARVSTLVHRQGWFMGTYSSRGNTCGAA
jgi:hypothetical protein